MRAIPTRRSATPVSGDFGSSDARSSVPMVSSSIPNGAIAWTTEGEIAIVLGKRGADLKASQLKDYVWGVTMLADWSIRAPRETPGGPLNFSFPKNFDTSCSMGPCIAVGDADPTNIDMETLVSGECRQRFNTRDMVFTFGEYLEYLSRDFTLYP